MRRIETRKKAESGGENKRKTTFTSNADLPDESVLCAMQGGLSCSRNHHFTPILKSMWPNREFPQVNRGNSREALDAERSTSRCDKPDKRVKPVDTRNPED